MTAWVNPPPHNVLRITDDTTPDELREAITNLCHSAKRCVPAVGWVDAEGKWYETLYDAAHRRINVMLDELVGA